MRDEWTDGKLSTADSRSSQGLTQGGKSRQLGQGGSELSAITGLTQKAMRLKSKGMQLKSPAGEFRQREVSERRQVGDAESVVNPQSSGDEKHAPKPWWKNVTMEEGM